MGSMTWGYTPAVAMRMLPGKRFAKQKAHAFRCQGPLPWHSLCGVVVVHSERAIVPDTKARALCGTCAAMEKRICCGRPS